MARALLALACLDAAALAAVSGVDVSTPVSLSEAQCMAQTHNISFGVARAWHSDGVFDPNYLITSKSWTQAGFATVDAYMFPCSFRDPVAQVTQMLGNLTGAPFGRVWLDVETNTSPGCGWSTNKTANCAYLASLVQAVQRTGVPVAVYSSLHMWTTWMDDASTPNACDVNPPGAAAPLDLWYPHYDKSPSFSDFIGFGGWTTPLIKQYINTNTLCGVGVDDNYAPAPLPPPTTV